MSDDLCQFVYINWNYSVAEKMFDSQNLIEKWKNQVFILKQIFKILIFHANYQIWILQS